MTASEDTPQDTAPPIPYHSRPIDEVLSSLSVNPEVGLTSAEAKSRLQKYGANKITKVKGSFWKVYLAPILNWLINIYIVSSIALLFVALSYPFWAELFGATNQELQNNEVGQAIFWLTIVLVNCLMAIFQQFRAQKKLEALEKLSTGDVRVIRNGNEMEIPPFDVVPGDVVKLEQGDKIPADARIFASSNLTTNEASLTGESVASIKDHTILPADDTSLSERANMVYFGTYVSTGTATVITTTTGSQTEIGKIQGELESLNTGDIPLRKKVNLLAKYLGIAALILMFTTFLWRTFIEGIIYGSGLDLSVDAILGNISQGIVSAMQIMPINIPLLTTIVLLTGVLAMAGQGVIIRDLSAVESLGRVSVICSDKTGTMTKNEMTVKFCWDTENLYSITGDGYDPEGKIYRMKTPSSRENVNSPDSVLVTDVVGWMGLNYLITCGGINNDAELELRNIPDQGDIWVPLGDPTDAALLTLFRKSGLDEDELRERYKIVKEFSFESELKRMSRICTDGKKYIAFVKGATEIILKRSIEKIERGKPGSLDPDERKEIEDMATEWAEKGYRVISLAYRMLKHVPEGPKAREQVENDLIYLGFAVLVDPPRAGVKEAVNAAHGAGINVIMITGDSAATARTIAEDLDIMKAKSLVVEGGAIESLTPHEFERVNVFARVNPSHKQIIVERYQDQNKVVAMTGDGVNDALALAMSDAGIAMGITGTDVAKEAADIVITDDSFTSIVYGVHEGRGLFTKIRMMVFFYIAINVFEATILFGGLFLLPGVSILVGLQNLYLIVTTHTFPALGLIFDKTSPKAMEEKPRDSEELITQRLAKFLILDIVLMIIGATIVFTSTLWGFIDVSPENLQGFYGATFVQGPILAKATVMMLTVILLVESILVLVIRRINMPLHRGIREPGIERYIVFLGLIYLAHILLMYVPIVQEILAGVNLNFYFMPLTVVDWIICILCALPAILGMELYKRYLRDNDVLL